MEDIGNNPTYFLTANTQDRFFRLFPRLSIIVTYILTAKRVNQELAKSAGA